MLICVIWISIYVIRDFWDFRNPKKSLTKDYRSDINVEINYYEREVILR
jgi:hypothetical protein